MLFIVTALAFAAVDLPGKTPLPIKEPDWTAWKEAAPEAKQRASKAWSVLLEHRPDRQYGTRAERQEAEKAVGAAYEAMDADKDAACAAGVEALRASKDDWERLMIATNISHLNGSKGEPFLLWTMATAKTVDEAFEPVFEIACSLASKRRPEYLSAVFSVLRTHEGHIYLPLHSWYIQTPDCLFYVLGRYGREVVPYLYPMLENSDPYVRRNAAIVLGYFMDGRAKPGLLRMLDANDVGSGGAAYALGQLGDLEAVPPISRLLKNPDARTRFWAAYALFEIGSKDALTPLEAAAESERDRDARQEMEVTIEHIRHAPDPVGARARTLGKEELAKAIAEAEESNGLKGEVEAIAATAGPEHFVQLEEIRRKTMDVPSDLGNKWFRRWTVVLKTIRRRAGSGTD